MSKTAVITARVDAAVAEKLDLLAREMERTRAWIVAKAIQRYVEEELELIAFIREGEEDIAAGRVHSQEEVEAMFAVRRDERSAA